MGVVRGEGGEARSDLMTEAGRWELIFSRENIGVDGSDVL